MTTRTKRFDPLTGNPLVVFGYYFLPTMISMLAFSTAGMVDGAFLGNYVGSEALAAVNLIWPLIMLFEGVGLMVSIGGAVMCGKLIGEGNHQEASNIFSKCFFVIVCFGVFSMIFCIVFADGIIGLIGAQGLVAQMIKDYLLTFVWFMGFGLLLIWLHYFVRTDGGPIISSIALGTSAIGNVILDWLLITRLDMGIKGAALATGMTYAIGVIILSSHFIRKQSTLRLKFKLKGWNVIYRAAYNGSSEFTNEISGALLIFMFNWIMMRQLGVPGVAAFTVVGYLLHVGMMICYSASDSMQPLVSKTFGARDSRRLISFLTVACATVLTTGLIIIGSLLIAPEELAGFFLKENEQEVLKITVSFINYFWPTFLFVGVNITLSSYFTSMQRPFPSIVVSFSRSLLLPAIGLLLLPVFWGNIGLFIAIPIAETVTFIIAIAFFQRNRPTRLVNRETQSLNLYERS